MFFGAMYFNDSLEQNRPHWSHQSLIIGHGSWLTFFVSNTAMSILINKYYLHETLPMSLR